MELELGWKDFVADLGRQHIAAMGAAEASSTRLEEMATDPATTEAACKEPRRWLEELWRECERVLAAG